MIGAKKLKKWREDIEKWPQGRGRFEGNIIEVIETLEALWKVAHCLASHDDLSPYDKEALAALEDKP